MGVMIVTFKEDKDRGLKQETKRYDSVQSTMIDQTGIGCNHFNGEFTLIRHGEYLNVEIR